MVENLLEGIHVRLRPLKMSGLRVGFSLMVSSWSLDKFRSGECL